MSEARLLPALERLMADEGRRLDAQYNGHGGYVFGMGIALQRDSGQPWQRLQLHQSRIKDVDVQAVAARAQEVLRTASNTPAPCGDLYDSPSPPYLEYVLVEPNSGAPSKLIVWAHSDRRSSSGFTPSVLRSFAERSRYLVHRESGSLSALQLVSEASANLMLTETCALLTKANETVDSVIVWSYDSLRQKYNSVAVYGVKGRSEFHLPVSRTSHGDTRPRGIVSIVRPESPLLVYDAKDRNAWRPRGLTSWEPRDTETWSSNEWRSVVCLPLTSAGLLLGAISLYSRHPASQLLQQTRIQLEVVRANLQGALRAMDERNRIKVLEDRFDSEFEQHAMSLKVVTHAHDLGNSVDSLKSTLNEVSGLADLPAGVPERLSAAADQAERIRELARMIADPARGENRTRRSECDADEVVRGISRYLENQVKVISEGRGRLSLEIEPRVKGYSYRCRIDPLKLERILDNLVGNAAYWSKYSTPRGDVTVSVAPAPELAASQGVLVRVRDNGRGVAEEFKPFIFDRFFTRRDSSSSSAGLGLGLYLVKKYIDEVGGSISLKSNPGLTEFSILLPLVGSPD